MSSIACLIVAFVALATVSATVPRPLSITTTTDDVRLQSGSGSGSGSGSNGSGGGDLSACGGYRASDVQTSENGLSASLNLIGAPCNVYGRDLQHLTLTVEYQTDKRLHVLIEDAARQVYQVPASVFPRPSFPGLHNASSDLIFDYVLEPFSFTVVRRATGHVLFDTSAASLIFEDQFVRLRTRLPQNPALYGTGEHTDPFMLNTTNYVRTVWNRDSYATIPGENLYGTHQVYYDHRGANGTHAVFLLNSNGMNYKIDDSDGQFLEYDILGGVLDLYFMAGPSPVDVAQQYSEIVGKSAMMPYWGLGFHQCRYGYRDVYNLAEVVANYSAADIPMETMWTDIDYMYLRRVFTLDPVRFPLNLMREFVSTLHDRQQHYVVMVDPAVAYKDYPPFNAGKKDGIFMMKNSSIFKGVVWPGVTAFPDWFHPDAQSYWTGQFQDFFGASEGLDIDALWIDMNEPANALKYPGNDDADEQARIKGNPPRPPPARLGSPRPIDGFPAGFQPLCKSRVTFGVNASTFYGENIFLFGNASTIGGSDGDISNAVLLDPSDYPIWSGTIELPANSIISYQYVRAEPFGSYVYEQTNRTVQTGGCNSTEHHTGDSITTSSPAHQPEKRSARPNSQIPTVASRQSPSSSPGDMKGLPGRELITPPYDIHNADGLLSDNTADTDLIHYNGLVELDTHNLYGAMMSTASRTAMLARRPSVRPLIITRSSFAGSGTHVGKWTGDNLSDWFHYLISITEILEFAALYQLPMVGADVCGFGHNTTELLCARWAALGAFYPFYRNHDEISAISQEFYLWPLVAQSARNAIAIRYQLLDYIYTAMYFQSHAGIPMIQPMFFHYPEDRNTYPLGFQFFFGPGLLVAPVTEENSTTASFYLPKDIFYDFYTHLPISGSAAMHTLTDVAYTSIPLFYKGGQILAQRMRSANTTTQLRRQDFHLVIAPGSDGAAEGDLYLDDGESIVPKQYSQIHFAYSPNGTFSSSGHFGYTTDVYIAQITVLGAGKANSSASPSLVLNGKEMDRVMHSEKVSLTEGFNAVLH